jgi:predicted dehydrogenase
MRLKVAIVGCGQIADGHVEEIRKLGNSEVVAVCDIEPIMAAQLAERYGIANHYKDFELLLKNEKPDVVHITTPPQSHFSLTMQALDHGCHVYVEKPFTPTYEEAKTLIDYAEKKHLKLTIGHTYEFDPPALEVMELAKSGSLGRILHVESFYGYNLQGSFGTAIFSNSRHWVHGLPGKLFQNNINHLLNKVTPFIQDERPLIQAMGYIRREQRTGDLRDDALDELRIMIKGEEVSAYATFSAHIRPAAHFLKVYGTKNTVHADFVSRIVTFDPQPTIPSALGRMLTGFSQSAKYLKSSGRNALRFVQSEFHLFSGLNTLISRFYDSILTDQPPPISYRDILRLVYWMDEIFLQLKQEKSCG